MANNWNQRLLSELAEGDEAVIVSISTNGIANTPLTTNVDDVANVVRALDRVALIDRVSVLCCLFSDIFSTTKKHTY